MRPLQVPVGPKSGGWCEIMPATTKFGPAAERPGPMEGPVATGEQIKALLKSHASGDAERFRAIALQIAAHAAKKGNTQLAQELRGLVDEARKSLPSPSLPRAVPIARPAGELAGLLTASYPSTRLPD